MVLGQEVARPRPGPPFAWRDGAWRLTFPRPDADRLEYLIGVDGGFAPDPANPLARRGPFGDKSVIEWPEYAASGLARLDRRRRARSSASSCAAVGSSRASTSSSTRPPSRPASTRRCSSSTTAPSTRSTPGLTRFLDAMSWEERIPPMRAALIQPVDRNETYSASALYAGALVRELLPQIAKRAPHGKRIGMGASLGALAMLHAQRRHPKSFDGLFLQSGSFFRRAGTRSNRASAATSGSRGSSARCCASLPRSGPCPLRSPAAPPRRTARTTAPSPTRSRAQGYAAWLAEIRDGHTWTCWRDAFDPNLPALIEAVL